MQSVEIFLLITILISLTSTVLAQQEDIHEITLNYKKLQSGSSLSLVGIQKTKGSVTDYTTTSANAYKLEVISSDNQVQKSMKFVVPIGAVLGLSHAKAQGTANNLDFTISVPYFKNANLINIYNKDNNKVLEIPLRQEINLVWMYVALPIILIVGYLTYVEIKRKKEHQYMMQNQRKQNTDLLRNYVTANLRKGYNKEQIKNALVKSGYNNQIIEEAFRGNLK